MTAAGEDTAGRYVAAIDQGTTSTRCIIFDTAGRPIATGQREHRQIFPRAGWVEHDPIEIRDNVLIVVEEALAEADLTAADLAAVGITNQRETTVIWDVLTGEPIHNAIVWQDTRTADLCVRLGGEIGPDRYREITGLPLSTYFAGPKIAWLLENVDGARARAEAGELAFGTIDSWVLWNLTGGVEGGVHRTDVTNASRTMLMDLDTLAWRADICADFGVPEALLPEIASSAEVHGVGAAAGPLAGVRIAGILGDQQAATFGQACLEVGEAKNTYGTGNFLLLNTGTSVMRSTHGLLSTVCYRIGDEAPVYALEGSVAVTGSLVQWLRDNLGIIESASQIEELAASVPDNGGVYIVPAFSGLFAPHWRPDARGVIAGLTRFADKRHLARAALEATAFQTREIVEAMEADSGVELHTLKVDGGMVANSLLMQFQADILGVPVIRPTVPETTALGAAYAAGIAVGLWTQEDVRRNWSRDRTWEPELDAQTRDAMYAEWGKAVERTFDWA